MARSLYTKTFCLTVMVFAFAASGRAQFIGTPTPPPPKAVPINFAKTLDGDGVPVGFPEQDKARITREKDEKERFKIYISYLDSYRDQTRRLISQNNSTDAIKTLSIYAGIARHAVTFLTN